MLDNLIVSTAVYDGYSMRESLASLAELGIKNVELAFISGYTEPFTEDYFTQENAQKARNLLKENGLSCPSFSSHVDLSATGIVSLFRKRMAFAKEVGSSVIVTNAAVVTGSDDFYRNMEDLSRYAEEIDIIIGLENPGDGVHNVLNKGSDADEVISRIGSGHVGINYDFGNLLSHCFEKVRPESDYKECQKHTVHYHVKDVEQDDSGWIFTPIGKGSIDYKSILCEINGRNNYVPVSLEIPLRLRRNTEAKPIRLDKPVPLEIIQNTLQESIAFIKEVVQ